LVLKVYQLGKENRKISNYIKLANTLNEIKLDEHFMEIYGILITQRNYPSSDKEK